MTTTTIIISTHDATLLDDAKTALQGASLEPRASDGKIVVRVNDTLPEALAQVYRCVAGFSRARLLVFQVSEAS